MGIRDRARRVAENLVGGDVLAAEERRQREQSTDTSATAESDTESDQGLTDEQLEGLRDSVESSTGPVQEPEPERPGDQVEDPFGIEDDNPSSGDGSSTGSDQSSGREVASGSDTVDEAEDTGGARPDPLESDSNNNSSSATPPPASTPEPPETGPGGIPQGDQVNTPTADQEPEPSPQPPSDSEPPSDTTPSDSSSSPPSSSSSPSPPPEQSGSDSSPSPPQSRSDPSTSEPRDPEDIPPEERTAMEDYLARNEDVSLDNDIDPGGPDDLDDPGSVVQLESGRIVSEDRYRTLQDAAEQINQPDAPETGPGGVPQGDQVSTPTAEPDTPEVGPEDLRVGTNEDGERVVEGSTQFREEQFAEAVENQPGVEEDVSTEDVLQSSDGPTLDPATEDAVKLDRIEEAAVEQFDAQTEQDISEEDVVPSADGAELDLEAQRQAATDSLDNQTETDVGLEDVRFGGEDRGFFLSEDAQREEAAASIDSETSFDVTASDVVRENGEFILADDVQRRSTSSADPGASPSGESNQQQSQQTSIDEKRAFVQWSLQKGQTPDGIEKTTETVTRETPFGELSGNRTVYQVNRSEVTVPSYFQKEWVTDSGETPNVDFDAATERPEELADDLRQGATPGSDPALQGQASVAPTAAQVELADSGSLDALQIQSNELAGVFSEQVTEPVADVAGDVADVQTQSIKTTASVLPGGESPEEAAGDYVDSLQDLTRAPENEVDNPGVVEGVTEKTTTGAVNIASTPITLPATVTQAGQTGASAVEFTGEQIQDDGVVGGTEESLDAAGDATTAFAAQQAQYMANNPFKTGGALVGSAVIMGGAARLSPQAGVASRAAIQPIEEAIGYGGNAALSGTGRAITRVGDATPTRVGSGVKKVGQKTSASADKLFPNNEPLIFSEEAAIRGGRRVAGGVRSAGSRLRNVAGDVEAPSPSLPDLPNIDVSIVQAPDAGRLDVRSSGNLRERLGRLPTEAGQEVRRKRRDLSETLSELPQRAQQEGRLAAREGRDTAEEVAQDIGLEARRKRRDVSDAAETVSNLPQRARQEGTLAGREARDTAGDVADSARETVTNAREAVERTRDSVGETVDRTRQRGARVRERAPELPSRARQESSLAIAGAQGRLSDGFESAARGLDRVNTNLQRARQRLETVIRRAPQRAGDAARRSVRGAKETVVGAGQEARLLFGDAQDAVASPFEAAVVRGAELQESARQTAVTVGQDVRRGVRDVRDTATDTRQEGRLFFSDVQDRVATEFDAVAERGAEVQESVAQTPRRGELAALRATDRVKETRRELGLARQQLSDATVAVEIGKPDRRFDPEAETFEANTEADDEFAFEGDLDADEPRIFVESESEQDTGDGTVTLERSETDTERVSSTARTETDRTGIGYEFDGTRVQPPQDRSTPSDGPFAEPTDSSGGDDLLEPTAPQDTVQSTPLASVQQPEIGPTFGGVESSDIDIDTSPVGSTRPELGQEVEVGSELEQEPYRDTGRELEFENEAEVENETEFETETEVETETETEFEVWQELEQEQEQEIESEVWPDRQETDFGGGGGGFDDVRFQNPIASGSNVLGVGGSGGGQVADTTQEIDATAGTAGDGFDQQRGGNFEEFGATGGGDVEAFDATAGGFEEFEQFGDEEGDPFLF